MRTAALTNEARCLDPLWVRVCTRLGAPVTEHVMTARDMVVLFGETVARFAVRPWRWREIYIQIVQMGVGSLGIIAVSTAFAGLVITNEIAWHMNEALHTISMIPGFTGQFIFRELGVSIPAMLLISKVGAATTAEVGSMKVTEQIEALKLLRIDPVNYLVFPRFVACIISNCCLTLIAVGVTLSCALSVAVIRYNFSVLEYLNALRHFVGFGDLACAMTKAAIYGAVIPIISCAYGFRCRGGAEGVGTATTNSVVASTVVTIVIDFLITYLFTLIL